MYWLGTFAPQRVLLDIGFVQVYWYGLIVAAAIFIGYYFTRKQYIKKYGSDRDFVDVTFWVILLSIVGARLWHVFVFQWEYYSQHSNEILKIWEGGIAIQGGILFGALTIFFYSRKRRLNPWAMTDMMAPALALGQAIGRWGNFFNQELFGKPTDLPWGIYIEEFHRLPGFTQATHFHPAFFYESILNLTLFLFLWQMGKRKIKLGSLTLYYILGYGIIRLLVDFIRIDPMPGVWGLRSSQIISLIFIIIAIGGIYYVNSKKKSTSIAKEE